MRRPSPATGIALVALFISLSGTAYAATGGNFLLGKANKASAVTSLSNKQGTALSLSSSSSAPPLTVGNSVQVPNLNASELDGETSSAFLPANGTAVNSNELGGKTSSAFLPANGTAVNSNELGGTPASGYMQGGGDTTGTRLALTGQHNSILLTSPGADLDAFCDNGGAGSGASLADQHQRWHGTGCVGLLVEQGRGRCQLPLGGGTISSPRVTGPRRPMSSRSRSTTSRASARSRPPKGTTPGRTPVTSPLKWS